jgi:excisionase family DNA binding protein
MRTITRAGRLTDQAPDSSTDRLMTVAETAHLMGVTDRMVRRLVLERRVEFLKVGRHVRIRESVANAFLEANTVRPAHAARWGV